MNDETVQQKLAGVVRWLPAYAWQRLARPRLSSGPVHLLIALADHFEPAFMPDWRGPALAFADQERRLDRWCARFETAAANFRDADGRPFRHTYFYPAEQHEPRLIERLAAHCHEGWGEIEIHLHHGVDRPDTAEQTRRTLIDFRTALVRHGCLSRWMNTEADRYAFVHGNWALANSANNQFCGVDEEMAILAETGCYADFTLPSAPNRAQVSKINAIYECAGALSQRAPHRRGKDLSRGRQPGQLPIIVQGPLGIRTASTPSGLRLKLENGEVTSANPPSIERLMSWCRVPILVAGQEEWVFIKLHCHGMDPRDEEIMFGAQLGQFFRELREFLQANPRFRVHFVTAREMVNIILAACDGRDGSPGEYRDYRLRLIHASG